MTSAELQTLIMGLTSEMTPRENVTPLTFNVSAESLLTVLKLLKTHPQMHFDMLMMLTALDWPAEDRIECLYLLQSSGQNHEVLISVSIPRSQAVLPSVSAIYAIAEWQEREVYDMFGILFNNHPDLRRILLDDEWQGFPLRKDYQDEFILRRPW